MNARGSSRIRGGLLAAALAAVALAAPSARAGGEEDPFLLKVDPFKSGLEFWERTGAWDKVFSWSADASTLAVKGTGGKEPPRIVYPRVAWDRFEMRFQVKKGLRKLRFVLRPVAAAGPGPAASAGDPVLVEVPGSAARGGTWSDVVVRVGAGRAAVLLPDPAGEKEIGATAFPATLPAGTRFRVGIEAPSGYEASLSGFRLVRKYENEPQVCEDGFISTFNGTDLGDWRPNDPAMASLFRVENGLLVAEVRDQEAGWLVLAGRAARNFELRMRAVWGSNSLQIRAIEVPGEGGKIRMLDTIQMNVTDTLEPEDFTDIVVRVEANVCSITVNGKKVLDSKVVPDRPVVPVSFFVFKGKKCFLRDLRFKDLGN